MEEHQHSYYRSSDVAGCLPSELYSILVGVGALNLSVDTLDLVAVDVMPAAWTLWLIIIESTLKVRSILVSPLSIDHLTALELAHILHTSLLEYIGSIAFLFAILPLAGVHIFVLIDHNTLAIALTVLPVSVVATNARVDLQPNAVLVVVGPRSLVGVLDLFCSKLVVGVRAVVSVAQSLLKVTVVDVAVGVCGYTLPIIVS